MSPVRMEASAPFTVRLASWSGDDIDTVASRTPSAKIFTAGQQPPILSGNDATPAALAVVLIVRDASLAMMPGPGFWQCANPHCEKSSTTFELGTGLLPRSRTVTWYVMSPSGQTTKQGSCVELAALGTPLRAGELVIRSTAAASNTERRSGDALRMVNLREGAAAAPGR